MSGIRSTVSGVVAAGVAAAVAASVFLVPWPAVTHVPASVDAVPTPADTVAVCDGGIFAAGRTAGAAGTLTLAADQRPIVAADGEYAQSLLRSPAVERFGGAPVFVAPPQQREAAPLAAVASGRVLDADLAGFAVDACRTPLFESWLVGGSTTIGATDLVVLANPGDAVATVDITVYGTADPFSPPGGTGLVVPAGTQLVVPLSGIAGGEASPVLRVTAAGAPVRASLQASIIRTLEPGGIDQQSAVRASAGRVVIPGLIVTPVPESLTDDTPTILRLLAPGGDGSAVVSVRSAAGDALMESTVPLTAGTPVEFELRELPVGTYTVVVDATMPIVGAVWQTTGFGEGDDFAWFTAAPALSGSTLLAVPEGPQPVLHLANPGEDDVQVVLRGASEREVLVPAGGTAAVSLPPETTWELDPGGEVHAQVTLAGSGALAGYAVWPSDAAAQPLRVYP